MPPKSRKNRCQPTARERLDHLEAEKKRLTASLRVLKQKARRRTGKDDIAALSLSDSFKWILLLLYVFGGYSVELAQTYWIRKRAQKKLSPLLPADTKAYIEDLYLATEDTAIWECAESNTSAHKFARKQAYVWHAKAKLREYVRNSNIHRGVAPSSRIIARRYNHFLDDIPFGVRPGALDDPAEDVGARVFLCRWRRSHGSKWGRIRVEDYVPLEEKRAKARFGSGRSNICNTYGTFFLISERKKITKCGPKNGGISWPHIWVSL